MTGVLVGERYKHTFMSERDSVLIYCVISSLPVSTYAIFLAKIRINLRLNNSRTIAYLQCIDSARYKYHCLSRIYKLRMVKAVHANRDPLELGT